MAVDWQNKASQALGQEITGLSAVSGGDFAQAYHARLANGESAFIKTHTDPPANFFSTESTGLRWLRDCGAVNTPEIFAVSDSPAYLVMQWLNTGPPVADTDAALGRMLANLHLGKKAQFGRPDEQPTGSLGVPNKCCDKWSDFYASQRLLPLIEIATDRHSLPEKTLTASDRIAANLDKLNVPAEPPALLHGDLWAGNRLVDSTGQNWLIDPAAHHGHREFDLAMMKLFGGFGDDCFAAYDEIYPLASGWHERIKLHQLAPLIVHAIKFGSGYIPAVVDAVRSYS